MRLGSERSENAYVATEFRRKNASYFMNAKLADGFDAFKAQGKDGVKNTKFYGVCDFSGNYEIHRKDGLSSALKVIGKKTLWEDAHVNVAGGQIPSGEIVLYRNERVEYIKPENPIESQDVFLRGEDEFIPHFRTERFCGNIKTASRLQKYRLKMANTQFRWYTPKIKCSRVLWLTANKS